jgi:hypothetical protein
LGYSNRIILERSAFASVEFRQALDILEDFRAFVLEILSQGPHVTQERGRSSIVASLSKASITRSGTRNETWLDPAWSSGKIILL